MAKNRGGRLRSNTVTRRIPQYNIKLEGDWHKTTQVLETIDDTLMKGALAGQKAYAERVKALVRRAIKTNGAAVNADWPPYSEAYAKYKKSKGYSASSFYRMTGLYYRSITIWNNGLTYYVGLKSGVRHPREGGSPTLAYIARVLETGSTVRNIKARPLWTPAFRTVGGNVGAKALILWHVRDQIRKTYNINPKVSI